MRFSTVAGNLGSADLARDVRGFAVKLYTTEGNWDIVGNNIPVFFIQDAIKFPDLVHSVKEEQDRGWPQADFDVLDPTKIIPEELVPVRVVARLTLDRTVTNVFAETEQVAFMTQNVPPGVDFSDDPLLQGRNFSYLDTQLKRLGSTNFSQLPVNAPRCPVAHFQRDGHMQMTLQEGRANYEPNSFTGDERGPRADVDTGFTTHPGAEVGPKRRVRAESFADHYSQAKLFWDSQTPVEQDHIVAAFAFELGKCELPRIRTAMLANLRNVDDDLATKVAEKLGMPLPDAAPARVPTRTDLPPSDALSILKNGPEDFAGRKLGVLVTEGTDAALLGALVDRFEGSGATVALVGATVGLDVGGRRMDHAVAGAPSALFDAVALLPGSGAADIAGRKAVVDFVSDAFGHLKVIGHDGSSGPLFEATGLAEAVGSDGVLELEESTLDAFWDTCGRGRVWDRAVQP